MKLEETRVEIGGLMRCCLATMWEGIADKDIVEVGDTVKCKYHDSFAVLASDGKWRWNPSAEKTGERMVS